ncbi:hypothetical protein LV478_04115 [Komagataeibacter oboediens]|uniref:hypothetical protein n=1 Tax=Komagataeibacter oboediens TaxID=65958 RepID=UPI0023D9EA14|nr:hypothetical protein [Komagataeibacter oboediens]WEQ52742.1 hypothetical protein LV478_04115 [Komagataeibacter oboediens]
MIVSPRRFLAALSAVAVMGVAAPVVAQTPAEPTTPAVSAPEHAPDAAEGAAPAEAGAKKAKHHGSRHHSGRHHGAKKAESTDAAPAAPAAQ